MELERAPQRVCSTGGDRGGVPRGPGVEAGGGEETAPADEGDPVAGGPGESAMDVKALRDIPPWDWPESAGTTLLDILRDDRAPEDDRLLAAELAGDLTAMNDELVEALLAILRRGDESEKLRSQAAISLGPVLEQADSDGFEDADDVPIAEHTFDRALASLQMLYRDADVPSEVRRRILEASVRAPRSWHPAAVRAAWASDDRAWRLTGVFCMRYARGFDAQILEALGSEDRDIHYEAVGAAGAWEVDAAWPHIAALVTSGETDKPLLLAAIEGVANIRPREAAAILRDLSDSDDDDVVEAVLEAMAMIEQSLDGEDEDGEDDEPRH